MSSPLSITLSTEKRKNPDDLPDKLHHGGCGHTYMTTKRKKMKLQFERFRTDTSESTLFKGICIYVDGFTEPSAQILHKTVMIHGGDFDTYKASRTTHIIATTLPGNKLEEMRTASGASRQKLRPVVLPSWIMHSVASGTLEHVEMHLIPTVRNTTQPSVSSIFRKSNLSVQSETSIKSNNKQSSNARQYQTSRASRVTGCHRRRMDKIFLQQFWKKSRLNTIGTWRTNDQSSEKHAELKAMVYMGEIVLHIDMDCFFAAVAMKIAEKKQKNIRSCAVVVAHAGSIKNSTLHNKTTSTSEVSSANYIARKFGIRAGMYVKTAAEKCKYLVVLPYNTQMIKNFSQTVMSILSEHSSSLGGRFIQKSIDEALIFLPKSKTAEEIANQIRVDIEIAIGCTASVGIGTSKILARLALIKAKPNGMFVAPSALEFVAKFNLRNLPGIGRKTLRAFASNNINSIVSLQKQTKENLRQLFGTKRGINFWRLCRGIDPESIHTSPMKSIATSSITDASPFGTVISPNKKKNESPNNLDETRNNKRSISAVCNWGIRFRRSYKLELSLLHLKDSLQNKTKSIHIPNRPKNEDYLIEEDHLEWKEFIYAMSEEISKRAQESQMCGNRLIVKIKRRQVEQPIVCCHVLFFFQFRIYFSYDILYLTNFSFFFFEIFFQNTLQYQMYFFYKKKKKLYLTNFKLETYFFTIHEPSKKGGHGICMFYFFF
eukprot:GSMAST32.ASY1.ANO1.2221.1 assembled CDS